MIQLSDNDFTDEINTGRRLVVDFYAEWCAPCRMMAPALQKLADKIDVAKVNIEDSPLTTAEFKINKLPTIIEFEGGREVQRFVGYTADLEKKLGL